VHTFWSVTMHDPESFLVRNPTKRYSVSSGMPFKHNADGSLDLYIRRNSPGKAKEVNWLPAPGGEFNLTPRMYWPNEKAPSIIDASWEPRAVTKAKWVAGPSGVDMSAGEERPTWTRSRYLRLPVWPRE
jgi:hypothetical protein